MTDFFGSTSVYTSIVVPRHRKVKLMTFPETPAQKTFWMITSLRWPILVLGFALIAIAGSQLPKLVKDTTADAFIDPDDPALTYRDKVEEIFGLRDPIVIAVINKGERGIFNPESLALVAWLTERVRKLDNVDPERVTSLATESNIVGTEDGMLVEEFFDERATGFKAPMGTQARADEIRAAIADFPLYQGSLVARDGTATIIVAELVDETKAQETYDAIAELASSAPHRPSDEIHVAGEAAVAGYLATYIDRDAQRLDPIAGIVITIVLGIAFVSLRGMLLPNLVVAATVIGAIGMMAALGVSFYVITNALVVNLIGIAVADSIHIFSQYYEELRDRPQASHREIVVRSLAAMWRPVTLTTLTTIAGFLALAAASTMPPMRYFGLFGALGVAIAWIYTLTFVPAAMTLWPKRLSRPFRTRARRTERDDAASRLMTGFGRAVLGHPRLVLVGALLIAALGAVGASRVIVEEEQIENFQKTEPLYQADKAINRVMDGTYYLDVVITTPRPEDLHKPGNLRRIERLQGFLKSLPHAGGTTSVADYIKQMHRAVNENRPEAYRIPDDPLLVSQLFLLYSASGDPTDFEEEVDYAYQRALVRTNFHVGRFTNNRIVVPAVEKYLATRFNTPEMTGTVTGRVNVDYHWIRKIGATNARSVVLSLIAVGLMAALVFRSLLAGIICLLPVGMAVLLVYAVMGLGGVWLGVGTSMFSAIAIGLGIDFSVHTIDRLRDLVHRHGWSDETIMRLFPNTGRALLFNFAAIALGFAVLTASDVPPLVKFGSLVAVAVSAAFLAAMTVIPALVALSRPAFLVRRAGEDDMTKTVSAGTARLGVLLIAAAATALATSRADAEELPSGRRIMERVVARDEGVRVTRDLRMELTDRSGTKRVRMTRALRRYYGREKRTIIFYLAPTNVKGTAFLTYDHPEPDLDDDQWLYLPALRKVRRISASNRGDYFLGTDFSYEEIKKENKVELSDYTFRTLGREEVDGRITFAVEGIPASGKVADELGYSRVVWRVDPEIWMSRKSDYWDTNGNHLKTITLPKIERIDGIWTALRIICVNHKTGHSTVFTFSNVDYRTEIPDRVFRQSMLRRGL